MWCGKYAFPHQPVPPSPCQCYRWGLACTPWGITKVTCSKRVSIQIRGATVTWLCLSPLAKAQLVSHFCTRLLLATWGQAWLRRRGSSGWILGGWRARCNSSAPGLLHQSPPLGNVHVLNNISPLSSSCAQWGIFISFWTESLAHC